MYWRWLIGLIRTRSGRLGGTIGGIALTVAFIACLGVFLQTSADRMTMWSIAQVPVDWQVQLLPGADRGAVAAAIRAAAPVTGLQPINYANVPGFEANTGGTVQTTGSGTVLGIGPGYFDQFPEQIRRLVGSTDGVMVAQQTAANLHLTVGDQVVIHRFGAPGFKVTITSIVDLPNADAMFQAIGGAARQAPPDNVMLLPLSQWQEVFAHQASSRPDKIKSEFHVKLDHLSLPADPVAASIRATGQGHNFEAHVGGTALLANNLAARLGAVREDALYARLIFLFLGTPGTILAILLTFAVAGAGRDKRRRDQALLRLRGATVDTVLRLAATEAIVAGVGGAILGILLGALAARLVLGETLLHSTAVPLLSIVAGLALSLAAILLPAWRDARSSTVAASRRPIREHRVPFWARSYMDFFLLVLAAAFYWRSAASGYQVVLAPESVTAAAVDYTAFLSPMMFWVGLALLGMRVVSIGLRYGRPVIAKSLHPIAGPLSDIVAATFARQARRLTAGIGLAALAFAFASSTAIFNATYEAQARVDAELTNGADVTVTGTSAAPASQLLDRLSMLPGVVTAQPMQHRYAYVGTDLQDLYGVDPTRIASVTTMSDAYFANNDARATLADLAQTPDGVLVSQETVNDYQLSRGDGVNLRLQNAIDHQYHVVPFHIVGVAHEFPTAPKDSFLVANAAYIGRKTGTAASEIVLIRSDGDPAHVALSARNTTASIPGLKVSQIGDTVALVGSSLTAIDLAGLTRLELMFALVILVASSGLILGLGFADRERTFAILVALGARPRQLGAFVWSEAALVTISGVVLGLGAGTLIAYVLVKLLSGVFDPPPEMLSVPWLYLVALIATAAGAALVAATGQAMQGRTNVTTQLRGE